MNFLRLVILAALLPAAWAGEAFDPLGLLEPLPEEAPPVAAPTTDDLRIRASGTPRSLLPGPDGFKLYRVAIYAGGTPAFQEIPGLHFPEISKLIPANPDLPVMTVPSNAMQIIRAKALSADELLALEPRALMPDQAAWCEYTLRPTPAVEAARLGKRGGNYIATGWFDTQRNQLYLAKAGTKSIHVVAGDIVADRPTQTGGPRPPTAEELQRALEAQDLAITRLTESYATAQASHDKMVAAAAAFAASYRAAASKDAWLRDNGLANAIDETNGGRLVTQTADGRTGEIVVNKRNYEAREELAKGRTELTALVSQLNQARADLRAAQRRKASAVRPIADWLRSLTRIQATIAMVAPEKVQQIPTPSIEVLAPRVYQLGSARMAEYYPGAKAIPFSDAELRRSEEARRLELMSVTAPPPEASPAQRADERPAPPKAP